RDSPSMPSEDKDRIKMLVSLLNDARAMGGCCDQECFEPMPELDSKKQLISAAEFHAVDMIERQFISHDDPDGIDATTRIRRAGYRGCAVGENISGGDEDPEVVLDEFMNSYEHCLNVLEPRFLEVGVALARDENNEAFWVVTFGGQ